MCKSKCANQFAQNSLRMRAIQSALLRLAESDFAIVKETKSATMNIFRFFFIFFLNRFVKVELSYVFTKNLFTVAENCTEK